MSLKTCRYCNNKYEDNWSNWVSKFCCRNCYKTKQTKYKINDTVYTYDNKKNGKYFDTIIATGRISNIYEVYRPTNNGLYQYVIDLGHKKVNRFEHQIFTNLTDGMLFVEVQNKRREIMRNAKNLLKEI